MMSLIVSYQRHGPSNRAPIMGHEFKICSIGPMKEGGKNKRPCFTFPVPRRNANRHRLPPDTGIPASIRGGAVSSWHGAGAIHALPESARNFMRRFEYKEEQREGDCNLGSYRCWKEPAGFGARETAERRNCQC